METKEIILPECWEVKEIVGNKIIVGEKEKQELPKIFGDCWNAIKTENISNWSIDTSVPAGMVKPVRALCKLLVCRNAWWKQLGWKPDWERPGEKHCIVFKCDGVEKQVKTYEGCILAFPTSEVRDQFLESFRDLIEEAKELL